jgi:GNAT superfamily N-acetyltransferase
MANISKGSDEIGLRALTAADIPLGMRLKTLAGWNQLEADWKMLLDAGGDNFMASLAGKDVGMVMSLPYQDRFTWIAMVLVDPDARRKGVGSALLNRSIEIASPKGAIRLDATPEGFELYRRLGFRTEVKLVRFMKPSKGTGLRQNIRPEQVTPMGDDELVSILEFDRAVFGADRSGILRSMYERNPEYAYCLKKNDEIIAYCLGRSGSRFEHIGPIISGELLHAGELLAKVSAYLGDREAIIDVFQDKPAWISLLKECGFTEQRFFTRMCLGNLRFPGLPEKQFAIAGPEIG